MIFFHWSYYKKYKSKKIINFCDILRVAASFAQKVLIFYQNKILNYQRFGNKETK